jgi:hypothetical protein
MFVYVLFDFFNCFFTVKNASHVSKRDVQTHCELLLE